jgi:hypothetical protein
MERDDERVPSVQLPMHIDDKPGNGLVCFKNMDRPCGPDCMAYLTHPPTDKDYTGKQWANCKLLVDGHKVAKHLTLLTTEMRQISAHLTNAGYPAPPVPR